MSTVTTNYERFIAFGPARDGYGGCWGAGDTREDAIRKYQKSGGKKGKHTVDRFVSELPFAPFNREATDDEADAYMNNSGLWFKRCAREQDV